MPKGIPVGTVAIGEDGAINAGIIAASIIALNNKKIKANLIRWRNKQTQSVKKKPN
jgi:Phosphoribosylcarboxyaminoimidazole (NCAIR) mutase